MRKQRIALAAALGLGAYGLLVRPWLLDWGSTAEEQKMPLPGDSIPPAGMVRHTRAVVIGAPPEAVWPWLVQIGDRRAGFYSYDRLERATGMAHYADGHSATRIHPEFQDVHVGDRIALGSAGAGLRGDASVRVLEPGRALVIGTWAFVLERTLGNRTRLLIREPYPAWLRMAVPARFGLLRALARPVGEPLDFVMERKMMRGLKQRAEQGAKSPGREPVAAS